MASDTEDEICTPPEITDVAKAATLNLLPEKSKKNYELAYKSFMDWRARKNPNSFSQDNVLVYFTELAQRYKSSSLWTIYSMLKATLNIHHNINIENYPNIISFLKRKSKGYKAKKAAVFTPEEVREFIDKAPDNKYLATKVAFIMGIMGCCRAIELYKMKVVNVHDHNTTFLVDVLDTKNNIDRQFVITGPFYNIVKKYINLRSPVATSDKFFLNFQSGKCTVQTIGINKFRSFGMQIATYLKLPSPEKYTGHSLRRSAIIYTDGGANLMDSKLHGGSKATSVAEGYIERSETNKMEAARKVLDQVPPCSSSYKNNVPNAPVNLSASTSFNFNSNSNISNTKSLPQINLSNCHVTFNFHSK